jgi:uncharacterized protein YndB with AHSA1/START domain
MNTPFVITRTLRAPRALVWQLYTQQEHMAHWFGPQGFTMPHSVMDLRPQGTFHYCMKAPNGFEMWGKWTFVDIVAPEKLVAIQVFSDPQGCDTRHPMSATWPIQTLATTTLTEEDGLTTLTLHYEPHQAQASEVASFAASFEGMNAGWSGTFDQLEAYASTLTGKQSIEPKTP